MNAVDYVIIGVIAASVLFGLYRGFISSVLGCGSTLISLGLSVMLTPKVAGWVSDSEALTSTLLHYTDASSRIGDLETALTNVGGMTSDAIRSVVEKVKLPSPLDTMLMQNLTNKVFSPDVTTVSDYVSRTIMNTSVNIICFVMTFAVIFILLHFIVNLIGKICNFPVLKQLDSLAGGAVGIIRGGLVLFVLFTLVPLVLSVVPVDFISQLIDESKLAPFFSGAKLISAIMKGSF